ncbi:MAG TPA: carbon monoxide dehydrogenase subunit G [Candidatus Acidoferrales bacterium]|nr:carbon monoxide dehydrogenase subunit G [Candidatus Acidoferrales bacterium]
MPFTFQGDFVVRKKPEEVYDFLADPQKFCPLLPDFERMTTTDPNHFTVSLKVGIAHIRGTATVKMALEETDRPRSARYSGKGSVAGGTVEIGSGFELEAIPDGTRVRWKGTGQVYGQLASLAGGLLEPLARKNVQRLIDSLQSALS